MRAADFHRHSIVLITQYCADAPPAGVVAVCLFTAPSLHRSKFHRRSARSSPICCCPACGQYWRTRWSPWGYLHEPDPLVRLPLCAPTRLPSPIASSGSAGVKAVILVLLTPRSLPQSRQTSPSLRWQFRACDCDRRPLRWNATQRYAGHRGSSSASCRVRKAISTGRI